MSNGKGSRPRPYSVPLGQYDRNWQRVFGGRKDNNNKPATPVRKDKKP